jgi:hypothetical protein
MHFINRLLDIKCSKIVTKFLRISLLWLISIAKITLIACSAVPIEYIPVDALDEIQAQPTQESTQESTKQSTQESIQQAEGKREIQRIAVLELKDQSNGMINEEERIYLSNLMRQTVGLLPQDQYPVMTQENILTLLPEGKSLEDCLKDCEVSIGRELGAHYVITGEVIRFGEVIQ